MKNQVLRIFNSPTANAAAQLCDSLAKQKGTINPTKSASCLSTTKMATLLLSSFMALPAAFAQGVCESGGVNIDIAELDSNLVRDYNCTAIVLSNYETLGLSNFNVSNSTGALTIQGPHIINNGNFSVTRSIGANNFIFTPETLSLVDGNDIVTFNNEALNATIINTAISLGGGNDVFKADGNFSFTNLIEGDSGFDRFEFGLNSSSKVKVSATVLGGDGSDQFIVKNATITGTLDAGEGDDSLTLLGNQELHLTGEKVLQFERLNIGDPVSSDATNLVLEGNQITLNDIVNGESVKSLNINKNSSLRFDSTAFTINVQNGRVHNSGKLILQSAIAGNQITINGNYLGQAGSEILINTRLGNDSSLTDRLIINGNTSGESKVLVTNDAGLGAKTNLGIPIILVSGQSDACFTLGAPVQVGSFDYFLSKVNKNWHLVSAGKINGCEPVIVPDNDDSQEAAKPAETVLENKATTQPNTANRTLAPQVLRPAVAGYLQAAQSHFDQTSLILAGYEQRQPHLSRSNDIWGRIVANQAKHQNTQFSYQQANQSIQFGKDISFSENVNKPDTETQRFGINASLGEQTTDYFDKNRAFTDFGTFTGVSSTNTYMLGTYYSQVNEKKQYFDLQAQLIANSTRFTDVYTGQANQKGKGMALSAEVGQEYDWLNSNWAITPQAQIIYQNINYQGFADAISEVTKQNAESLRMRLGLGFKSSTSGAKNNSTRWNASAHIWQELLNNPSRTIAGTALSVANQQKPWAELAVGIEHDLNETSQLSAQISRQQDLAGSQKMGDAITFNFKMKW